MSQGCLGVSVGIGRGERGERREGQCRVRGGDAKGERGSPYVAPRDERFLFLR